ncbi:MAG: hypothetical protein WC807_00790 [Hyphomicrobium sp.]|jgi:hypothetical protein
MTRIAALFCAFLLVFAQGVAAAGVATPDDTARLLAGLSVAPNSPLETFTRDASWQSHAKYFDKSWKQLEERQLSKIHAWSVKNIPNRRPVMLYMFSGPDFLYADAFFKGASTYVLSALEPVGPVPDVAGFTPRQLAQELHELQGSLNSVLSYSFFITKKMKTELNGGKLSGTLPVLYTFLARSGKTVRSVSLVALKTDGTVVPAGEAAAEKGASPGAKIEFSEGAEGKVQTLYYFSTDLSDGGVKASGFFKFCESLGPADSFVKSASYLMHSDNFSKVREFLVKNSAVLVQDDSGVPLRFFDPKEWHLTGFGRYLAPLGIFPGTTQPKMYDLFAKGKAQPLDFGIGYRWHGNESNLLLAVKITPPSAQAP